MRYIVTIVFTLLCISVNAQTVINGTVLDANGKTVDAYVTVAPKGAGIISYADTDKNGHYILKFTTDTDSIIVTASGLSIGNNKKTVPNRTQKLDFHVEEQGIKLKDVTVKAQKIRQSGDTLNYLVGAYKQQGDRIIGDVLKRMPGIEVTGGGGIKFNGKSISKFYVEDMDLLQGRYGLATNNINAQDVATVQVLENHQPVKALQGKTLSDDVAINLKLKDSAKGTVAVNAMLGGGAQTSGNWHHPFKGNGFPHLTDQTELATRTIGSNPLWTAELVGMYFAKRRQNMTIYKGNNTGDNISRELASHYSSINSVGLDPFCPTGVIMPSGSGLPQKRTFDNHSHIMTMNHLEKLDSVTEATLNVVWYNDRISREGSSTDNRFVSDDKRLLTSETMVSETKTNNLNMQFRYNRNSSKNFVADVLQFDISWNSDDVKSLMRSANDGMKCDESSAVSQHFHSPQLSVSNTFNIIRNIGKHTFNLHFSAGFAQKPNTLYVGIDSILKFEEKDMKHEESIKRTSYTQDITSRNIAGNFYTNFNYRTGAFTMSYGVTATANLHDIKTNLNDSSSSLLPPHATLANNLWYNIYELSISQHYKYSHNRWQLSLGCPLNLYTQTLDDRALSNRHTYTHLLFTPSFSTNYEWRDWSVDANVVYYKNVGDPGGIYSGYIMNNYRSFQRAYVDKLSKTEHVNTDISLSYRSALSATFIRLGANYSHSHDNQIYGYTYHGATSVVQVIDKPTSSDICRLNFEGSQGFDWLMATIRIFGGYCVSKNERLIGGELYPFHSHTVSIGGGGTITPLSFINVVLSAGYSWNMSDTNDNAWKGTIVRSGTCRMSANIYITKKLTITTSAEDNYNNLTAENRHAWFGDATAKLKLKHIDLELQFNNVFNQRQYTSVSYSGLDIYTQTSKLRPMSIIGTIRFKLL